MLEEYRLPGEISICWQCMKCCESLKVMEALEGQNIQNLSDGRFEKESVATAGLHG